MVETRSSRKKRSSSSFSEVDAAPTGVPDHAGKHAFEYEFGGPLGAAAIMPLLTGTIYFLFYGASKDYKFNVVNFEGLIGQLPQSVGDLWSTEALLWVVSWFVFHAVLERVLFHEKVPGVVLSNGQQLLYRMSGHLQFWVTLLVVGHGCPTFDAQGAFTGLTHFPIAWLYDSYLQLATASMAFAMLMSLWLYLRSFARNALLAPGGDSGNVIYDFFIGRELNPRIGSFDLKQFCELRPGLIGWMILNLGCLAAQHQRLGRITPAMALINIFQGLYVFDALYHERAILTTMDITTDGFGVMLAFGDLAWVPFTYSLQARYLVENSPELGLYACVGLVLLNFMGYMVFRGANSQKDAFRRDPEASSVAHLRTLETKTGRRLLISGWWGLARKINYTGDWTMGLAWCLCTGFDCVLTYFYSIYFLILLVHRAYRDDHACSVKYQEDWAKYKKNVPYMFIPGIL